MLEPRTAKADEPTRWEQLFFPFPIVGAPPQLEQQVQLFGSYFHGDRGSAAGLSAELAYIVSPHVGLVATIPSQLGIRDQPTGLEDVELLVQYLAAGELAKDVMLSVGVEASFPSGRGDLGDGDYFVGPFAYAAKRWFHHLVVEADATALLPIVHGASARQIVSTAMVSVLVTPREVAYPIYAQVELDSTTQLGGAIGSAEALFVAPEIFIGPFHTPVDDGVRVAAGISFELAGDPVHRRTYMLTAAFDIPNRYGY